MAFADDDAALVNPRPSAASFDIGLDGAHHEGFQRSALRREDGDTGTGACDGVQADGNGGNDDDQSLSISCGANVKCDATWNPDAPGGARALFLGDRMMFPANPVMPGQDRVHGAGQKGPLGVADQQYDTRRMLRMNPARALMGKSAYQEWKADAKATAVIVHELVHLLHEALFQAIFWQHKRAGAPSVPADIAMQVSAATSG